MSPETTLLVQLGTAGVAAFTSLINLVLVFAKRKLDPNAMQMLDRQFKEIERVNVRNARQITALTKTINGKLGSVESALARIEAASGRSGS